MAPKAEYVMTMNPASSIGRSDMIQLLTEIVDELPGIEHEIEQPIAHLINHMLSGVAAQIAIKIHGDDLDKLKSTANEVRQAIELIETTMQGRVVSQFFEGQRSFDILLRMDEEYRQDLEQLDRLHVDLPGGATTVLGSIAKIEQRT